MYGPNGFFREFSGNGDDPKIDIVCDYQRSRLSKNILTGNVEVKIMNPTSSVAFVEIIDNSYGNRPVRKSIAAGSKDEIMLPLSKSFGWYDFTVRIKENKTFFKRYAGRVENGKEGFSDPYMGNVV